ncbi:uncharacterized protein LOC110118455 [Ceratitis capitata]|uniref:uncharacterized protein LOC110118455 n=1 Tax=Ceratitis capitata TaxID=7213 RepID=UPI000A0F7220|nr:uncharacterized protein LOC110118455 [Ceratitis capitata]
MGPCVEVQAGKESYQKRPITEADDDCCLKVDLLRSWSKSKELAQTVSKPRLTAKNFIFQQLDCLKEAIAPKRKALGSFGNFVLPEQRGTKYVNSDPPKAPGTWMGGS